MSSQSNGYSKRILKKLGDKPVMPLEALKSLPALREQAGALPDPKIAYALTRSIKNLVESGLAELHYSGRENYIKLTKKGRTKLNSIRLMGDDALVPTNWDGFWRIVILDISEERKSEREALRYLLKKANFTFIKNTVWISPLPYENLFINIKKDLGLSTELMIIVTDKLDDDTSLAFHRAVNKN